MKKEAWDKIQIKNLEVFGNHGVFPEENKLGQKFLVNAVLYTDTREAGRTDDLTKSIHYGDVSHVITAYMMEHTFQLIESVAEQLARVLLLRFEHLKWIDLEIQKPWAPIGLPLESVSVEISRGWHEAFIATGSNLGDRGAYIEKGIEALKACEECVIEAQSELIITEPYGVTEQPEFLNGMIKIRTLLSPQELLHQLHEIEASAQRERNMHWGPRTLDLDIIFYDDLVLDTQELTIPHADMQNREFVLEPLRELASWYRHPVLQKTVEQMLEELKNKNKLTDNTKI